MKCYLWALLPPSNTATSLGKIANFFFSSAGYKNPLPPHIPLYGSSNTLKEFSIHEISSWPETFSLSDYDIKSEYPLIPLDQTESLLGIKEFLGRQDDENTVLPADFQVPGFLPLPLSPKIQIPPRPEWPDWEYQTWKSAEIVEWELEFPSVEEWFAHIQWRPLRSLKRRLKSLN